MSMMTAITVAAALLATPAPSPADPLTIAKPSSPARDGSVTSKHSITA